jgi:hypothetical protein
MQRKSHHCSERSFQARNREMIAMMGKACPRIRRQNKVPCCKLFNVRSALRDNSNGEKQNQVACNKQGALSAKDICNAKGGDLLALLGMFQVCDDDKAIVVRRSFRLTGTGNILAKGHCATRKQTPLLQEANQLQRTRRGRV